MTLPCQPVVEIRLGTGAGFGDVLILGDPADGILGENVLGTAVVQVVDVSSTTQRISIRRGRDRMFEEYSPGQATIQFLDLTGDWNPSNTSSPYYGQILPMRQVRIHTTYNGTAYYLFTGFITSWDWEWADQAATYAIVTIQTIDAFRLLQLSNITTVPGAATNDLAGVRMDQILDAIAWPSTLRAIDDGDTEVQNDPGTTRQALAALQNLEQSDLGALYVAPDGYITYLSRATLARYAAGFWDPQPIRTNLITNPSFETNTTGWGSASGATLTRTSAQQVVGSFSVSTTRTSTTGNLSVQTAPRISVEPKTYTFSLYFRRDYSTTRSTQLRMLYYDAASTLLASNALTITPPTAGTWGRFSYTTTAPANTATIFADVVVFNAIVGETIWVDGVLLEQSSTLGNYFDGTNYIPGGVYDAADTAWTGTADASTSTCIEYDTTPYTFRDDGTGIDYQDLDVNLDETELANQVTLTREGGTPQTVSDATSIDDYFLRSYNRSGLMIHDNATTLARATAILGYRKVPRLRIDSMTLDLSSVSSRVVPGLKLDIGDPVIIHRDMAAGTQFTVRNLINGINHDITPDRWRTTFTTAYPLSTAFILDSSEFGILGTNTL